MIQWLIATEEGPNTFWARTKFTSLEPTQHRKQVYRRYGSKIQVLLASEEGPNTEWVDFDSSFDTLEDILLFNPPADDRAVLRAV